MYSNLIPKDLDENQAEQFKAQWKSSRNVRHRLKEIFNGKLETILKSEEKLEDLEQPNWKERQAYKLGQRQMLRDFIKYLDQEVEHE